VSVRVHVWVGVLAPGLSPSRCVAVCDLPDAPHPGDEIFVGERGPYMINRAIWHPGDPKFGTYVEVNLERLPADLLERIPVVERPPLECKVSGCRRPAVSDGFCPGCWCNGSPS
jgi:hypothetical protein